MMWLHCLNIFVAIIGLAAAADDPRAVIRSIGFDQRLGAQVPLDAMFTDESGTPIRLGHYFGDKPVILMLVYHQCPMLCGAELTGLVTCLRAMPFTAGKEFQIITISFNPKDTSEMAAQKKTEYMRAYGRPGADKGWHFLTGDASAIASLTQAVGFRYRYDEITGQFAHASGILLVTPDGRISRYCFGVEYYPRDIGLGLVEASQNKIGTLSDQVLLYCYRYDPMTGKYGLAILNILRAAGGLTVIALGTYMVVMFNRDKRLKISGASKLRGNGVG